MKIVFMGTPDFAEKSLEAIYNSGYEIVCVVTNPDKPKGRGMKVVSSPVKEFAINHNLKVYEPSRIKDNDEFFNEISKLNPDLFCVVAYGKILPEKILKIPKYGAINVHGSLLPKYRGAAPIQMAIINGDKETGVTTMFMDKGMDTGDIILSQKVNIRDDETTGELWEEMSIIGAELLVKTIKKIEEASKSKEISKITNIEEKNDTKENKECNINCKSLDTNYNDNIIVKEKIKELVGAKKQGTNYTIAPMITKEMTKINWNKTSEEIYNLVRGLSPKIGAFTFYNEKKIKIWKAKIITEKELENLIKEIKNNNCEKNKILNDNTKIKDIDNKFENGQIITADKKNGIIIKTKNGAIQIIEIQAENSKKMNAKDFLNGNKLETNVIL